jgi:hypothetical protein
MRVIGIRRDPRAGAGDADACTRCPTSTPCCRLAPLTYMRMPAPLAEPAADRSEKIASLHPLDLIAPESRQAHRRRRVTGSAHSKYASLRREAIAATAISPAMRLITPTRAASSARWRCRYGRKCTRSRASSICFRGIPPGSKQAHPSAAQAPQSAPYRARAGR